MNSATDETTNQRKAMPPPSAPGTKPAHPGEETAYEVSARSGGGGGRGAASKKKQGDGQQGKGKGREARVSAGGKGVLSEEEMMLQDAEAATSAEVHSSVAGATSGSGMSTMFASTMSAAAVSPAARRRTSAILMVSIR